MGPAKESIHMPVRFCVTTAASIGWLPVRGNCEGTKHSEHTPKKPLTTACYAFKTLL